MSTCGNLFARAVEIGRLSRWCDLMPIKMPGPGCTRNDAHDNACREDTDIRRQQQHRRASFSLEIFHMT